MTERRFLPPWSIDELEACFHRPRPRASIPALMTVSDYGWGGGISAGEDGVLPVWACGLGRTLLAAEVRNAYWRQLHAMRVQAFIHATVPVPIGVAAIGETRHDILSGSSCSFAAY